MSMRERIRPEKPAPTFVDRLDRAILSVFPTWGAERIATRKKFRNAERIEAAIQRTLEDREAERGHRFGAAYEGADKDRLRGENWLASNLSPDTALFSDLPELRKRSRDLFRNDCYFSGAVSSRVDNVVGRGIRPEPRVKPEEGVVTAAQAETINNQLKRLYKRIRGRIGYENQSDWQIQRLIQRQWDMDGECFVLFSAADDPERRIPLVVEVIDAARCETPPARYTEGRDVRLGVERAGKKIVAYWFRTDVPDDQWNNELKYERIEASRVCHLFEKLFPDQSRGVPWLFACLGKIKDIKDLAEAELIAAETQACWAMFIKTEGNAIDLAENNASVSRQGKRIEDIEPGMVGYLGPGEEPVFSNPSRPGGTFAPFMESNLRAIAAGLGHPFEMLAKNYSLTNYSASRMSIIEGRIVFRCRQQFMVDLVLQRMWDVIVQQAILAGEVDISAADFVANRDVFTECAWITPGWPWIDPSKDIKSAVEAIANNLSTETDELAAIGKDREEVAIAREQEVKDNERRGIIPLWALQVAQVLANAMSAKRPDDAGNKPKAANPDDHHPLDPTPNQSSEEPSKEGAKA